MHINGDLISIFLYKSVRGAFVWRSNMKRPSYFATILIVLLGLTLQNNLASALNLSDGVYPLNIELTVSQNTSHEGMYMLWQLTLTPTSEQVTNINIESGNDQIWLVEPVNRTALSESENFQIKATPIISGDLIPSLQVKYKFKGKDFSMFVIASSTIKIIPIESQLEMRLYPEKSTYSSGSEINLTLWIRNSSPQPLTLLKVNGLGNDINWANSKTSGIISPGDVEQFPLMAKITGDNPIPRAYVILSWQDSAGQIRNISYHVEGVPIHISESLFSRIPAEVFGLMIGLIAGALSLIVQDRLSRGLKKSALKNQVKGILQMLTWKAEHATQTSLQVDLRMIETLLENEEMYLILKEFEIVDEIKELWRRAEEHNTGLSSQGGSQRSENLRLSVQQLLKKMAKN
jgi:hypothetical protein